MASVVIGIIGARGGAGASVTAAALAHAFARRQAQCTLIDLAPDSGGIEITLGTEAADGLRWPDLSDARGALDGAALRRRLTSWGKVAVLSAGRQGPLDFPQEAAPDVCAALSAASDVVVVDLARATATIPSAYARQIMHLIDDVLLVTPLDLPAFAGAMVIRDAIARYRRRCSLILRGPTPGTLTRADVTKTLGIPEATWLQWDSHLAGSIERGSGPVPHRSVNHQAFQALAGRYPVIPS